MQTMVLVKNSRLESLNIIVFVSLDGYYNELMKCFNLRKRGNSTTLLYIFICNMHTTTTHVGMDDAVCIGFESLVMLCSKELSTYGSYNKCFINHCTGEDKQQQASSLPLGRSGSVEMTR